MEPLQFPKQVNLYNPPNSLELQMLHREPVIDQLLQR